MFVWHHRQGRGGRPGTAALSRGAAHAAWDRHAATDPARASGWGEVHQRGPPDPWQLHQAPGKGSKGPARGAGWAGPNHMVQKAQAARHLFLSLSRTSAPIPPHRWPLPSPGPRRDEASCASRRHSLFA